MARTVESADGHSDHMDHFGHDGQLFLAVPYGWEQPGDQSEDDQSGYVAYPQAAPRSDVTGATTSQPCNWREQIFNVPSSAGGTRPIAVTSCR